MSCWTTGRRRSATSTTALVPVVFTKDGTVFANSRDVASYFGKRHDHVMARIREIVADDPDGGVPDFRETPYTNPQNGETYHRYDMTRDGFTLLVMGFMGKQALAFKRAYIKAFNAMEGELKRPVTPGQIGGKGRATPPSSPRAASRARQKGFGAGTNP